LLDEISSTDRHARDFTRKTLRDAIRETIACFPVYRSYIDERGEIFERDRAYIQTAIYRAKLRNTGTAASVFDFLRGTLLTDKPAAGPDLEYRRKLHFILKYQQLTGPVMAKGLEDTAAYVYNRFVSNNEVGCLPNIFGSSLEDFHAANLRRLREWPHAMVTTSTHDTKRSEDVRARLNVLSEIPSEWSAKVSSWRRLNAAHKTTLADGRTVPSPNEEYLLYQTLVGAWPLVMRRDEERADFTRRVQQYLEKAIHEAKVNVSWINPNPLYSAALSDFIARILEPGRPGRSNYFLKRIEAFLPAVQFFGVLNSLAQVVLKITSPGVPDIYQGTELFDFSLVDPDNRRPVDFVARQHALEELQRGVGAVTLQEMLRSYPDGRVKLWTTLQALSTRREERDLFREGEYVPLEVVGERAEHVCAFARQLGEKMAVTIVPRFAYTLMKGAMQAPLGEVWGKTYIVLPPGPRRFRNVMDTRELFSIDGALACRDAFADFPVALLVSEA
jgi:(1->4)-alpha-D-glucan 1-alpha-D-glucosylmutase